MAQPAPQRIGAPTPDATVTITDGVASPTTVTIQAEGVVQFTADGSDYLIELWDKRNENHPAVCVYLAANSSLYFVGDPDTGDHNAICPYNVKPYADSAAGGITGTGGGNKIIIGSGLDTPNS
jgi:hypothetical protein